MLDRPLRACIGLVVYQPVHMHYSLWTSVGIDLKELGCHVEMFETLPID